MIYLDNAATTEMTPEVRAAARMANEVYGNANALNKEGRLAREKIERARGSIAFEIGAIFSWISFISQVVYSRGILLPFSSISATLPLPPFHA